MQVYNCKNVSRSYSVEYETMTSGQRENDVTIVFAVLASSIQSATADLTRNFEMHNSLVQSSAEKMSLEEFERRPNEAVDTGESVKKRGRPLKKKSLDLTTDQSNETKQDLLANSYSFSDLVSDQLKSSRRLCAIFLAEFLKVRSFFLATF